MVSTFAMDLFKDPFFIGFNRELDRLNTIHSTNAGYPPYNVLKLDEDNYQISLALAGFTKDDINVSLDKGTLNIAGDQANVYDAEVIHQGIATRKFTRSFALGEYMEVTNAEMKDGMLHIHLERQIPEDKKPKQISIN